MVRRELQRLVDEPAGILVPAEAAQQHGLGAQRLRALATVQEGFLPLVERERLLESSQPGEEPPGRLQGRPVLRVELVRALIADGRALRVAELLIEDAPHRVMDLRRPRRGSQRPGLRFEVRELLARGLDLRVGRLSLRGLPGTLLRDDRVHSQPEA